MLVILRFSFYGLFLWIYGRSQKVVSKMSLYRFAKERERKREKMELSYIWSFAYYNCVKLD